MDSLKLDPVIYHAHHSLYDEDIPFWMKLAERCGGNILELGCGTGRLLIPLAQTGRRVIGLDLDEKMLNYLAQRCLDETVLNANFFQADMRSFHLDLQFSLVFLACNTWSTFSAPDRQAILASVNRHLAPGGIFAASLPNPRNFWKLPRESEPEIEEIILHPLDGEPVQISSSWKRDQHTFSICWIYDHLLPNGQVARAATTIQHYLTLPEDYFQDLNKAGLNQHRIFGDFNLAPYRKSSPYLIFLASQEELPEF